MLLPLSSESELTWRHRVKAHGSIHRLGVQGAWALCLWNRAF